MRRVPTIDTRPGKFARSLPPLVRRSAEEDVQLVVLLDGLASWGDGAAAAARCHQALSELDPSDLDPTGLVAAIVAPFAEIPPEWTEFGGWAFSVAAALVRDREVTTVASGALTVVHATAAGSSKVFAPDRLVDRFVQAGQLTQAQADVHDLRHVIASPFFEGDPETLAVSHLTVVLGDRLLLGPFEEGTAPAATLRW